MKIVDAQVHIWAADSPERPWPGRATAPQKPYPVTKELIIEGMDEGGIDRAILVPPSWDGDRNDIAIDAVQTYPDRFAIMGRLAVESADAADLAALKAQPGMLGARFTFHTDLMRPWLTDGTADWLWSAAEELDIPLMVLVPGSVPALGAIAEQHPRLRLIVDHLALMPGKDDVAFANLDQVLRLARLPNVAAKASAMPFFTAEIYPFPGLHKYIRQVYDAFGPQRMFWGTDWTRLPCPWREAVDLFTEELPWLTTQDKELIMGRAICEWLDWPLPAEASA